MGVEPEDYSYHGLGAPAAPPPERTGLRGAWDAYREGFKDYYGPAAPEPPEGEYDYNSPSSRRARKPQMLWDRDDFASFEAERAQRGQPTPLPTQREQPIPMPTGGVPPAGATSASVLPTLTGLPGAGGGGPPAGPSAAPQGGGGLPAGSPAAPSGWDRFSQGVFPAAGDAAFWLADKYKNYWVDPLANTFFGPNVGGNVADAGHAALGALGRHVLDRDGTMMPSLGYGPPQVNPDRASQVNPDRASRGDNVKPGDPGTPEYGDVPALPPLRHPLDLPGGVAQPTYVMDNDGTRMLLPQVGVPPLQPAGNFPEQSGAVSSRDGAGVTREQQEESLAKLRRILEAPGAKFESLGIDNPQLPPGTNFAPTPEQVAFGHNASRIANRISLGDADENRARHQANMNRMRRPRDNPREDRARRGPTGDAADVLAQELRMAGMMGAGVSGGYSGGVGLGANRRKGDPDGPFYGLSDKLIKTKLKTLSNTIDRQMGEQLNDTDTKSLENMQRELEALEVEQGIRADHDSGFRTRGTTVRQNAEQHVWDDPRNPGEFLSGPNPPPGAKVR